MNDNEKPAAVTELMLNDLEHWRTFLLRARSRAGETPEAPVHIDHLTAAALCIGNLLKALKSAAPAEPPSRAAAPQDTAICGRCGHTSFWHANFGRGDCQILTGCGCHEFKPAAPQESPTPAAGAQE
jgi:hypothetical protein